MGSQTEFDVNSFSSWSADTDSSHVVEDVPDEAGSGTGVGLTHRDELFSSGVSVTGSGSYVGGSADATYHVTETGSFATANSYSYTGEQSSGYDEDGDPYDLTFNFQNDGTSSGNFAHVHDYHDGSPGLELTGASFSDTGTSSSLTHTWGVRNGEAYDTLNLRPESLNASISVQGESGPVTPEGVAASSLARRMTTPMNPLFLVGDWPDWLRTTPVRGRPGSIQNWYNRKVEEIGGKAAVKVANLSVKRSILLDINDSPTPQGAGTFVFDQGWTLATGLGQYDELSRRQTFVERQLKAQGYDILSLKETKATITYAVEDADKPVRSGNLAAEVRINFYFEVKNRKTGAVTTVFREGVRKTILLHDGKLERMTLAQP